MKIFLKFSDESEVQQPTYNNLWNVTTEMIYVSWMSNKFVKIREFFSSLPLFPLEIKISPFKNYFIAFLVFIKSLKTVLILLHNLKNEKNFNWTNEYLNANKLNLFGPWCFLCLAKALLYWLYGCLSTWFELILSISGKTCYWESSWL